MHAFSLSDHRNKRIRYNLKVSIKKRDRDRLLPAVDDFKGAKLPDDDLDLPKAEKLLKEFKARDGGSRDWISFLVTCLKLKGICNK